MTGITGVAIFIICNEQITNNNLHAMSVLKSWFFLGFFYEHWVGVPRKVGLKLHVNVSVFSDKYWLFMQTIQHFLSSEKHDKDYSAVFGIIVFQLPYWWFQFVTLYRFLFLTFKNVCVCFFTTNGLFLKTLKVPLLLFVKFEYQYSFLCRRSTIYNK
jgi:hypothetical protein